MKHLIFLVSCLLTLSPARAQSMELPPPADCPTDVRPVRGLNPTLRWTSTGDATWSIEHSTDLQGWEPLRSFEATNAPGRPVTLDPPLPGPVAGYFRLVHRHASPVILTPPADVSIQPGVPFPLIAQVDGDFPLISRWYHGDTLIATGTNRHYSVAQHQLLENGDYWLTVANPWGSVTSQVAHAVMGPRAVYAPLSLAGRVLELSVQTGTTPLISPERFRLKFAPSGRGCEVEGILHTQSATGSYDYYSELIRATASTIYYGFRGADGAVLPISGVAKLDFRSATNGTFQLSGEMPAPYTGTGEFYFVQ